MNSVSAAIETLCNASNDEWQNIFPDIDHARVKKAIRKLRDSVKVDPEPRDFITNLLQRFRELKTFFSQSPANAVGQLPNDFRITDICMLEKEEKTLQLEFRRTLALRSLAMEYDASNPRRLAKMIEKETFEIPSERTGSIATFAQRHFPGPHKTTVTRAITTGLKLLAIEHHSDHGMTAILGFAIEWVRTIKFKDAKVTLNSKHLSEIRAFGRSMTSWMEEVQKIYDDQGNQGEPASIA